MPMQQAEISIISQIKVESVDWLEYRKKFMYNKSCHASLLRIEDSTLRLEACYESEALPTELSGLVALAW